MKITIEINTDNVEDVKVKVEKPKKEEHERHNPYARLFGFENENWRSNVDDNRVFLLRMQDYFNMKLQLEKKVYINDVYEALGFPRVERFEHLVGWVYEPKNPVGDNFIDFGLFVTDVMHNIYDQWELYKGIFLDFNVDGDISNR